MEYTQRTMTLELDFANPLSISLDSIDRLVLVVLDQELFTSMTGVIIA